MGAVGCTSAIHDAVIEASAGGIELFHGYTYSAHPLGCAAALACLDIYEAEGLYSRAAGPIGELLEEALHSMADLPGVVDVRNYGLVGAIEFKPADKPGAIGTALMKQCWGQGLMVRAIGDAIAVSPPLVIEDKHIAEFREKFRRAAEAALA
jgi:beta-alanine--pyruvate transaminase